MTEQVKVTQADRDAAQALCASAWTHAIEAFARHRIATQAELLEALEVAADYMRFCRPRPAHLDEIEKTIAKAKGEV